MIKLFGAFLCISGSLTAGIGYCREKAKRLECLSQLVNALELMHSELLTNLTPLRELMKSSTKAASGCVKSFFEDVGTGIDELGKSGFYELWYESCRKNLAALSEQDMSCFLHLGLILGRAEIQQQLSSVSTVQSALDKSVSELRAAMPVIRKTSIGLSGAAGLIAAIVFL